MWRFAFERCGDIYDSDFHNQSKALSDDVLSRCISADDAVIDIGCGVGRWCRTVARYARLVTGIDYSKTSIQTARLNTAETNFEYIIGDVTKELAGRQFDLALLIHVIEHIDNPDEILTSLRNVTKKLIVEVPDFEGDALNLVQLDMNCPFYSDADHVREYTQKILNDQLTRNGWNILENRKNGGSVLAIAERA